MNFNAMSDTAILQEIGRRIQGVRLNQNMSQEALATKAGIARRSLYNLESGHACTLTLLTQVLRVLEKLDALDSFLPEPGPSPLQLAKLKGHQRVRASKPRGHHKQGPV
jgi:transcriptional regulator with XRE-family HTH domain